LTSFSYFSTTQNSNSDALNFFGEPVAAEPFFPPMDAGAPSAVVAGSVLSQILKQGFVAAVKPAPPTLPMTVTLQLPREGTNGERPPPVMIRVAANADAESIVEAVAIATGRNPQTIELQPQGQGGFSRPADHININDVNEGAEFEVNIHPIRGAY
jgi:hypothetical protein